LKEELVLQNKDKQYHYKKTEAINLLGGSKTLNSKHNSRRFETNYSSE
jgi:hypothetical protein